MDILTASAEVLTEAGFSTSPVSIGDRRALTFEDNTVLGFVFAYHDPSLLIEGWSKDADKAVAAHQFALRRAAKKAWNAYVVLLTDREADYIQSVALGAIEEDLVGTRKIARAGVVDVAGLRIALLPLLARRSAAAARASIRPRAVFGPATRAAAMPAASGDFASPRRRRQLCGQGAGTLRPWPAGHRGISTRLRLGLRFSRETSPGVL
jgi:hypothetical protein